MTTWQEIVEDAKTLARQMAKARTWVNPHENDGSWVEGHWRDVGDYPSIINLALSRVSAAERVKLRRDGITLYHVGLLEGATSVAERGLLPGGGGLGPPHPGQDWVPEVPGVYGNESEEALKSGSYEPMLADAREFARSPAELVEASPAFYRFTLKGPETDLLGQDDEGSWAYIDRVPPEKIEIWDPEFEEWWPVQDFALGPYVV